MAATDAILELLGVLLVHAQEGLCRHLLRQVILQLPDLRGGPSAGALVGFGEVTERICSSTRKV